MKTLGQWLQDSPFTLALSSSFFGFYAHCGIATALEEQGLKPQKITGSSAGALVAGGLASGIAPLELRDLLFEVRRTDFWDPKPGLGFLHGRKFLNKLENIFVSSFSEVKIPLAVAAVDILSLRTRFLNQGSLPKAVAASCAVPVLFHPVSIGGRYFTDGGVLNKAGVDPADVDSKALCVFLESDGFMGIYEKRELSKSWPAGHRVLRMKNLPRVNFYTLAEGREAYQEGYRRGRAALEQRIDERLVING